MSRVKSEIEVKKHRSRAIGKLISYIDARISSGSPADLGKMDKLLYWIEDYSKFLIKEETYDSQKAINYAKGDIVKIHLGYRIGSEEGGLHFGVVVDNNNSKSSNVLTIVPLTSKKEGQRIHSSSVDLGSELFKSIISKHDALQDKLTNQASTYKAEVTALLNNGLPASDNEERLEALENSIDKLEKDLENLKTLRSSILKMK